MHSTLVSQAQLGVARVKALILLTARHGRLQPQDVDEEAALFLDCDMAILAAPAAVFDAYDAAIAEEYRGTCPACCSSSIAAASWPACSSNRASS